MTEQYQQYLGKYFPKQTIIDDMVSYYGEQHRKYIEEKINNMNVVFVPTQLALTEVEQAFSEVYKDKQPEEIKELAFNFVENASKLSVNYKPNDLSFLIDNKDVLVILGFNIDEIIAKNSDGDFILKQTEETKKLANFTSFSVKKAEVKSDLIGVDNFISLYNECLLFLSLPQTIDLNMDFENNTLKLCCMYRDDIDFIESDINFPDIEIKDKEDEEFLENFIKEKELIENWTEDYAEYVVNGINKLFNKNHQTMQEVLSDESLVIFIALKDKMTDLFQKLAVVDNTNMEDYAESLNNKREFNLAVATFANSDVIAAFYTKLYDYIGIPINNEVKYCDITHETNHSLNGVSYCDTDDINEHERAVAFNEIVNEFLNFQMLTKNGKPTSVDSKYNYGIHILNNFLNKYEDKLKDFHFKDSAEELKNFIGEKNYNTLMNYSYILKKADYGSRKLYVNINGKYLNAEISKVLTSKRKYELAELVHEKQQLVINLFLKYDNFLQELVENFQEFEKGNIVDIPLKKNLFDEITNEV